MSNCKGGGGLDGKPLRTPIKHSNHLRTTPRYPIERSETDERSFNTIYRLEIRGFLPNTTYDVTEVDVAEKSIQRAGWEASDLSEYVKITNLDKV